MRALAALHLKDLPLPQPSCLSTPLANPALKFLSEYQEIRGNTDENKAKRGCVTCQGHLAGSQPCWEGWGGWRRLGLKVEESRPTVPGWGRAHTGRLGWQVLRKAGASRRQTRAAYENTALPSPGMARLAGRALKAQPWENLFSSSRVSLIEKLLGTQDHMGEVDLLQSYKPEVHSHLPYGPRTPRPLEDTHSSSMPLPSAQGRRDTC